MNAVTPLDWLASLEFFGIKLGLDQTRELFRRLGNPEKNLRFIHVAGSNGKGSVCAYIESALRKASFKTGFYSSPHLVQVTERFRINGVPCSHERLEELIEKLRLCVEEMAMEGMKATYFEVTTALAVLLFDEEKVDFVVWETGMGGRLDATNIVTPELSVITGISFEHSERLGNTLTEIAFEKAGIIKPGIPVFCASTTPPEALETIINCAKSLCAPLYLSEPLADRKPELCFAPDMRAVYQTFTFAGGGSIKIPLPGLSQRCNASLAYKVMTYLAGKYNFALSRALEGFTETFWPARMQFLPQFNLIIDAAHNPEGIEALVITLRELFPKRKFHFIFGAFSDKDAHRCLELLADIAEDFCFVPLRSSRASRGSAELILMLKEISPAIPARESDLDSALRKKFSDDTWKILCGSLHLCGEALETLDISL